MNKFITIDGLVKAGVFNTDSAKLWSCTFSDPSFIAQIKYQLLRDRLKLPRGILLSYNSTMLISSSQIKYAIGVTTTRSWLGKDWYWFSCPLKIDQHLCHSQTRQLILLPNAPYFACKDCYNRIVNNRSLRNSNKKRVFFTKKLASQNRITVESWEGPVIRTPMLIKKSQLARTHCKHCGHWLTGTYCPSCGQPSNQHTIENHFKTLGLPVKQHLDQTIIKNAYRSKVREYHPDQLLHFGAKIKQLAAQEMQRINDAYRVLKDDHTRHTHWHELKQLGVI